MAKSTITPPEQGQPTKAGRVQRSRNQNTLRNIALISGREYKSQVTQRAFIITTIIYLVVITIASFIPTIIQVLTANTNSQTRIVAINDAGSVAGMSDAELISYIATNLNGSAGQNRSEPPPFNVQAGASSDLNTLKNRVQNGELNILLVLERESNQDVSFSYYSTSSSLTDNDRIQIENMAGQLSIQDKASRQNLSPDQVNNLLAPPQFTVTSLQQDQGQQDNRSIGERVLGFILAYVGAVLIFVAIITYGTGVAQGVAEEKGSRIMEILINAATPFQLMVGKIIGIGTAGLTQMATLALVGITMLAIQSPIQALLLGSRASGPDINITGPSVTLLLLLLVYFILAFALYASLFAAAGALVNRQEETRNAGTPVTMLYMIGYIVSVSIASIPDVPNALWVKVMSYVPFWSPTMMLMRIGAGTVAWWEILLTIVLMLITIPLCAWISARIYRFGVLMYGQKASMGQLAKLFRAR